MSYAAQVEARNTDDTLSLTSLESGADDFDQRMIQTLRDQRRLNDAPTPKIHAFSKARVHPRVGVTLENLERHNAKNNAVLGPNAHVKFQSSPSSSGSTRSDPALNVPNGWGRKGRIRRNWMRTITAEGSQTSGAQDDTIDRIGLHPDETPPHDADEPRQSVEDSPLSHKSSLHGTPASQRRQSIDDWSFDMNEASLIASTPYRPRNTVLDDIRQREIEALKEQGVATTRLDKIRESSPEETRRPRSASNKSTTNKADIPDSEQADAVKDLSELRPHRRNKSWQAVGKAPAITGEGTEGTPVVVYKKSTETIGMVDSQLIADVTNVRRPPYQRDASRDLLRRLARASSTPSPGRPEVSRPETAPTSQISSSSRNMGTKTYRSTSDLRDDSEPARTGEEAVTGASEREKSSQERAAGISSVGNLQDAIDATPKPAERSTLNPKTPVVTGAWVDTIIGTPSPSILQQNTESSRASTSPRKGANQEQLSSNSSTTPGGDQNITAPEVSKPHLPRSVLGALVEEARASGHRRPTDYGDSTINSLEELIAPLADSSGSGEPDDDTIPIDVSTQAPRNEAERRRQEELLHIQNMDRRLRSTRTSLRDTSRGIRRVEEQIERGGERTTIIQNGRDGDKLIYREYKCPCAESGGHQFSLWKGFKLLFYNEGLKPKRRGWGLTWLSIFLLTLLTWFVLENICCEIWGHHAYATSYKGYGVVWGAPEYPYVLPTMAYRAFIKPWWRPLYAFIAWIWEATGFGSGTTYSMPAASTTAARFAERILVRDRARATFEEEATGVLGMAGDEVVR